MQLPTAYCEHAKFASTHASVFLKIYGHLLTWRGTENLVADVGCANGEITTDVLLPRCIDKIEGIIGIDISSEMLRLANERNKEPKVTFVEMDVAKTDLDSNMVEKFDRIFSFNCLHLIHDQTQCAENLYKMLKPGGEAFLTFNIKNSVIESWFTISSFEKWATYIGDFPKTCSLFFTSAKPQEYFEDVYTSVGFSVESHRTEPMKVVFTDLRQFKNMVVEMNVLVGSIPEHLREEFLKEHVEFLSEICKIGDSYEVNVQSIVAIVKKPIN